LAEPGRGVVDFDAVTAAMPEDYDGDYMIEVVEPSVDSPYDSYKIALAAALPNGGRATYRTTFAPTDIVEVERLLDLVPASRSRPCALTAWRAPPRPPAAPDSVKNNLNPRL
jgi:hypothetical protein